MGGGAAAAGSSALAGSAGAGDSVDSLERVKRASGPAAGAAGVADPRGSVPLGKGWLAGSVEEVVSADMGHPKRSQVL